ncbi:MAG TPA: S41 family peptidase [Candidatus Acidoferrum sp.]
MSVSVFRKNALPLFVFLAFALGTSLSAANVSPASRSQSSTSDPGKQLSRKTRQEVFEKVWKDIDDHYYDKTFNGVDWDAVHTRYRPLIDGAKDDREFYAVMSRMTGELHDAHTRFNSPEQWKNYKKQQGVGSGISLDEIDGKTVITAIRADSDAAHAGISPGMIIRTVDGKPVNERIAEIESTKSASSTSRATRMFTYNRLLAGPADTQLKLGVERADGSQFETEVTRQIYSSSTSVATDTLPSGNGYIRFDGFQPSITKEFRQALERFRNTPGLVVDLRRNGGGDLGVLMPIAGYFFDKKTLFAKDETRSGKPLSEFVGVWRLPLELYVGRSGDQIYAGPVVILVDAHSASSSEVFAAGMQDSQRAKIIGSQSCGCVLGIAKPRVMKGGGVLEMSEVLWYSPKGRRLEGTGILPDETVLPTLRNLQRRQDPALEAADRALVQMTANARRPSNRM